MESDSYREKPNGSRGEEKETEQNQKRRSPAMKESREKAEMHQGKVLEARA